MKRCYDQRRSVAFTGHRSLPSSKKEEIGERVGEQIRFLYSMGYRYFFCGMAIGFDMLAAGEVVKLKPELEGLKLIAVIPYRGQCERWSEWTKLKYRELLRFVDDMEILSENYFHGCFLRRNDFMLNQSSALISYYDGSTKGGTFYTVRNARRKSLRVVNVYA